MSRELTLQLRCDADASTDQLEAIEAVIERHLPGLAALADQYGVDLDHVRREGGRTLLINTAPPRSRARIPPRFNMVKALEAAEFGTFGAGFTPAYPLDHPFEDQLSWLSTVSFNREERWIAVSIVVRCDIAALCADDAVRAEFIETMQDLAAVAEPLYGYVSESSIEGRAPLHLLNDYLPDAGNSGLFGYDWMTVVPKRFVPDLRPDPAVCSSISLKGASHGGVLVVADLPPAFGMDVATDRLRAVYAAALLDHRVHERRRRILRRVPRPAGIVPDDWR